MKIVPGATATATRTLTMLFPRFGPRFPGPPILPASHPPVPAGGAHPADDCSWLAMAQGGTPILQSSGAKAAAAARAAAAEEEEEEEGASADPEGPEAEEEEGEDGEEAELVKVCLSPLPGARGQRGGYERPWLCATTELTTCLQIGATIPGKNTVLGESPGKRSWACLRR